METKLKLKLEDLKIESFQTWNEDYDGGTVFGASEEIHTGTYCASKCCNTVTDTTCAC